MAKKIAVGIDIGTYQIKVVVAESPDSGKSFHVYWVWGMPNQRSSPWIYHFSCRHNPKPQSGISSNRENKWHKIKRAFLSIGGIGLESIISTASIMISRGDSEIDRSGSQQTP